MNRDTLVVVPCGKSKIWDHQKEIGPTPATEAYIGDLFKLNRQYAERFGKAWVILSAKYGFVEPEFEIPGPYNVAFKHKKTQPIGMDLLRVQVKDLRLQQYSLVVGLGGVDYRNAIVAAFAPFPVPIAFPFAGLPIGLMLQATKRAIRTGQSMVNMDPA